MTNLLYELATTLQIMSQTSVILITGGTGSFGQKLVTTLLSKPQFANIKKIIIFSRDEYKQSLMKSKFNQQDTNNKLRYFIGDIREYDRLLTAFYGVDIVFHTAALKRIQECEYNPMEAIKTNILGTENVVKASIANKVKYVIGLSTDKACNPVNLYGSTKLCAEKLLINGNLLSHGTTKFAVCRYGNQFGSRGSLVEIFHDIKNRGDKFTVTDPDMTRFTILLQEAVNFVIYCLERMQGGEIFVPVLPSYSIEQMLRCFGVTNSEQYDIIGVRAGEKMHELMVGRDELAWKFNDVIVITPMAEFNIQEYQLKPSLYGNQYTDVNQIPTIPRGEEYDSKNNKMISDERLIYLINNWDSL